MSGKNDCQDVSNEKSEKNETNTISLSFQNINNNKIGKKIIVIRIKFN